MRPLRLLVATVALCGRAPAAAAIGERWYQLGDAIDGLDPYDNEGQEMAMSRDGRRVVVASRTHDPEPSDLPQTGPGVVRVFEVDPTSFVTRWRLMGAEIHPPPRDEDIYEGHRRPRRNFGQAVAMDASGRQVLVGGGFPEWRMASFQGGYPKNHGPTASTGGARLYSFDGAAWVQTAEFLGDQAHFRPPGERRLLLPVDEVPDLDVDPQPESATGALYTAEGCGRSVALSADGRVAAMGCPWYNPFIQGYDPDFVEGQGRVKVFEQQWRRLPGPVDWLVFDWRQKGNDIVGVYQSDHAGYKIDLSADGDAIVLTGSWCEASGNYPVHARIFSFDGTDWVQTGGPLGCEGFYGLDWRGRPDGEGGRRYGARFQPWWLHTDVALSDDGRRVAFATLGPETTDDLLRHWSFPGGATNQFGMKTSAEQPRGSTAFEGYTHGVVRAYEFRDGNWTRIGQDIIGPGFDGFLDAAVDLNAPGDVLAIGNPHWSDSYGQVRVYTYFPWCDEWVLVGRHIKGGGSDDDVDQRDKFGWSVALSGEGWTLGAGAPGTMWQDDMPAGLGLYSRAPMVGRTFVYKQPDPTPQVYDRYFEDPCAPTPAPTGTMVPTFTFSPTGAPSPSPTTAPTVSPAPTSYPTRRPTRAPIRLWVPPDDWLEGLTFPPTAKPTRPPPKPTRAPTPRPVWSPPDLIDDDPLTPDIPDFEDGPVGPPDGPVGGCSDAPAPEMKGQLCAKFPSLLKKECAASAYWTKYGYCQASCYALGRGYKGSVCGSSSKKTPPAGKKPTGKR